MMKRSVVLLLFLTLSLPGLFAQSMAADMDRVLDSEEVTWAQAARFVLPAAGFVNEAAAVAFRDAQLRDWLPRNAEPDGIADFGGLSFLLMKAFDIPGGMMYRIFPGPRYAYRELQYLDILQGQHDYKRPVSGFWLIALIGRAIDIRAIEE
jgi:hypothetical protein